MVTLAPPLTRPPELLSVKVLSVMVAESPSAMTPRPPLEKVQMLTLSTPALLLMPSTLLVKLQFENDSAAPLLPIAVLLSENAQSATVRCAESLTQMPK